MAGETIYCDDYEAIVGPKPTPVVETKVVEAPAPVQTTATVVAQTA